MLRKGLDQGFKDVDVKQGIVKGQFCSHKEMDLGGDISEYGSLSKTIQERGPKGKRLIKFCLNHKREGLPGVLTDIYEDQSGGFYTAKIGTNNEGVNFLKMVESEIINQHSYGYKAIKEVYDSKSKVNILKELSLAEVSAVEFLGMNPNTTFIELKQLEDAQEYMKKLEKFFRNSDCTDDLLITIENHIKSLSLILKPSRDTLEIQEADQYKSLIDLIRN